MTGIVKNRLLAASICVVLIYFLGGYFTPPPYISGFISLMLFISGLVSFARYLPETIGILFRGVRSNDEHGRGKGSHLAIYGVTLLSFGATYGGAAGLLLLAMTHGDANQAQLYYSWVGSVWFQFGRFCSFIGFVLMWYSPNVTSEGLKLPEKVWLYMVLALLAAAIFWAGTQFGNDDDANAAPAVMSYPICPKSRPVIGSRNHIYHGTMSVYRAMTKPYECFKDEEEAEASGYRAPVKQH